MPLENKCKRSYCIQQRCPASAAVHYLPEKLTWRYSAGSSVGIVLVDALATSYSDIHLPFYEQGLALSLRFARVFERPCRSFVNARHASKIVLSFQSAQDIGKAERCIGHPTEAAQLRILSNTMLDVGILGLDF